MVQNSDNGGLAGGAGSEGKKTARLVIYTFLEVETRRFSDELAVGREGKKER